MNGGVLKENLVPFLRFIDELVDICKKLDPTRTGGYVNVFERATKDRICLQSRIVPAEKIEAYSTNATLKVDALMAYPESVSSDALTLGGQSVQSLFVGKTVYGGGLRFPDFCISFSGFTVPHDKAIAFFGGHVLQGVLAGARIDAVIANLKNGNDTWEKWKQIQNTLAAIQPVAPLVDVAEMLAA
jgi:hypothetical protein